MITTCKRSFIFLMALATLSILCMTGNVGPIEAKTEPLKIGVALALGGPASPLGQAALQGLKLAVEQYVEKGGFEVAGKIYTPELLINDTGGSPANGVAQAEKLVYKDKVKVIFGCIYSPVAVPMLAVTQPAKVIQVSNATSWEDHLGKPGNDYMFKLMASQADTARSYIPAVVKKLNIKTAVMILPNNDAGRTYDKTYRIYGEKSGVKMPETYFYDPKLQEFYPILTRIGAMNPDSIWIGYTNEIAAVIVRQANELKIKSSLVGLGTGITGVAGDLPGGGRVEGFTFCTQYDPESKNPGQLDLVKRFEKMFNMKVTSDFNYVLWYNDTLHMITHAMQKAESVTDTTRIMRFIRSQKYKGPYGYTWEVDKTGLNHYDYYMGEIKGGKDVFTFVPLVMKD